MNTSVKDMMYRAVYSPPISTTNLNSVAMELIGENLTRNSPFATECTLVKNTTRMTCGLLITKSIKNAFFLFTKLNTKNNIIATHKRHHDEKHTLIHASLNMDKFYYINKAGQCLKNCSDSPHLYGRQTPPPPENSMLDFALNYDPSLLCEIKEQTDYLVKLSCGLIVPRHINTYIMDVIAYQHEDHHARSHKYTERMMVEGLCNCISVVSYKGKGRKLVI